MKAKASSITRWRKQWKHGKCQKKDVPCGGECAIKVKSEKYNRAMAIKLQGKDCRQSNTSSDDI